MQRKWRRDWERGKQKHSTPLLADASAKLAKYLMPPLVAASLLFGSPGLGQAAGLPDGGTIRSGSGTISQSGHTMDINQYTSRLAIDWTSFSIGSGNTVNFYQPGRDSIALNRVLGNDASQIYGNLNANGQVFLINPNGVLFAKGAQVNVGGIVASTLDLADDDFRKGKYRLSQKAGKTGGSVVNAGAITAANGGYVALLGTTVANNGTIMAQKGSVALGAGNSMTLDFSGDGLLNLAVDQAAVDASAVNHNLIQADGGQVIMTARAANDLAVSVVNNTGVIRARTLENRNGVIRLDGGTAGVVTNSGTLDASGKAAGQQGGTVKVLGETVRLDAGSSIDVSGDAGGGAALIGGNYQGEGSEQNATNTTVAAGTTINADAITTGSGGQVVVWANDKTVFNGAISAKGGSRSGDGGSVETSGHTLKVGDTASVTTRAAHGKTGNWLLDPADFYIGSYTDTSGHTYAADITGAKLSEQLESNNITIKYSMGKVNPSGNGNIIVSDALSWNSSATLTLNSSVIGRNTYISINAPITATRGGLTLMGGGRTMSTSTKAINVGTFFLSAGAWRQVATDMPDGKLPLFSATYFSKSSGTSFLRALGGDGTAANPYQLTDRYGLQGIDDTGYAASQKLLDKYFILANDIDLAPAKVWNNGQGFIPIGGSNGFRGSFDGAGHTIANLYINYTATTTGAAPTGVGLFSKITGHEIMDTNGTVSIGAVRNLHLTNVDITGSTQYRTDQWQNMDSQSRLNSLLAVGGLAGVVDSADIDNISVTGKVTGRNANAVGGLAGLALEQRVGVGFGPVDYYSGLRPGDPSQGLVRNSSSTAAVTASGDKGQMVAGGLIGELDFNNKVGKNGTVGNTNPDLTGFVRNSYSSGPVTVTASGSNSTVYAGGLVGLNQGMGIDHSYSTGNVTVNSSNPALNTVYAGGLVGASGDFLYTEATSGGSYKPPFNHYSYNKEAISDSYSSGTVSYSGAQTYVGGFAGANSGVIQRSYWIAGKSGPAKAIGASTPSYTVNPKPDAYTGVYGLLPVSPANPVGLTRLTAAQAVARQSFQGWDFDKTWFMLDGYTMPFLRSEYSTRIGNAHQLQLMVLNPAASYTLAADLDLRDYTMAPLVGFVPINNFSGQFDGQGHTISYLNIHDYSGDAVGLFARTNSGAAIHDLALANASVSGTAANRYTGILAGYNAAGSQIYNTYTGGTVSGSGSVGGSVGGNAGTLTTSFSSAKVSGGTSSTGGLVGDNSGSISDSYLDEDGSVTVGSATVGNSAASRLAGTDTGTVTAPDYSGANWRNLGGNRYLAWTVAPDDTVSLYTASQLQALQNYLSGSYRLRADLDLDGRNWTAIGTAAGAFTGRMDGGGYTIANLKIESSTLADIGLFGYTQGAALSNLTLTNVNIAGGTNNQHVGGLVGYSDGGSITNAKVDGTVSAGAANAYVGGLAGYASGSINSSNSAATVTAQGPDSYAGGLAGYSDGSIAGSANSGEVKSAGPGSYAGGLAGLNAGSIVTSSNSGAVMAQGTYSYAGGVAGSNSSTGVIGGSSGYVSNTGAVTTEDAHSFAGGIAGRNAGVIGNSDNAAAYPTMDKDTGAEGTVYNTGQVTARGAYSSVGGVAGLNTGRIAKAYNAALVAAYGDHSLAGGLAGDNQNSIQSAFFGATASGSTARLVSTGLDSSVGGIAGANSGSIADTNSFAWISSSGAGSRVGGLVGANSGSLETSFTLGAVDGTAGSLVGGLIGTNSGTVTNVIWNPDSAFSPTDPRYRQKQAVGDPNSNTNVGKALSYADMLNTVNWSGFGTGGDKWTMQTNLFPRLGWQPEYGIFGRVQGGGPGVTVNKYGYDYRSANLFTYTTHTFGADGLYLMTPGGTSYSSDALGDTVKPRIVLFTVAGQPYQANSLYVTGLNPTLTPGYAPVFYDLYPGTLLFRVPQWTSKMMANRNYQFNVKDVFDDAKNNALIPVLQAGKQDGQYPDLMFTVSPAHILQGDWHKPGQIYDDIYLIGLDVQGDFDAADLQLFANAQDWAVNNYYNIGASITTHKTAYAKGSLTLDNSLYHPYYYNFWQIMLSAQGQAVRYTADGDITIKEAGSLVLGAGSSGPRLQAGGDITITCGNSFVNWAGADAIRAGGRYLIYARDMLLAPGDSAAPSFDPAWAASESYQYRLFFNTRYLDTTYAAGLRLASQNKLEQLLYDTRSGLPGFVLWGYQAGGAVPAGSGFIYTRHDPNSAAGIKERSWLTPDYFAAQARRQWAVGTTQAGRNPGPAATHSPAAATADSDPVTVVDGGVALPPAAGN